jgi:hypothetical protein
MVDPWDDLLTPRWGLSRNAGDVLSWSELMRLLRISATVLAICLVSGAAQAQATRTWVSGVGDDANSCSRTAPYKTFAGAISKTQAGGEIDALDPAGYGALTITKAIAIDGGGGQVASVLQSGTNGMAVQAGPSDAVVLRNLEAGHEKPAIETRQHLYRQKEAGAQPIQRVLSADGPPPGTTQWTWG